ncbi:DUF7344 domain-containing protein [Haloprofundus marisrubri]|uniref:DUF7344 domain-containing protein n=1 Tax=Haloprofundus marisrubri TaxID=1514971 RepID=UPI0012BAC375|nr:hypothetical protein [Haloprofundus marisrubri]
MAGRASPDLGREDIFYILRNKRRRFALHHLKHQGKPVSLGELSTRVAAWENEVSVEEVTTTQRRRVYNSLQQSHLPELVDAGLVNMNDLDIELTPRADTLKVYLEVVSGRDIPWSEYYLGLGFVALALQVVTWLDVGVFASFPDGGVGVLAITAFVVSAGINYYTQRRGQLGNTSLPPELRN